MRRRRGREVRPRCDTFKECCIGVVERVVRFLTYARMLANVFDCVLTYPVCRKFVESFTHIPMEDSYRSGVRGEMDVVLMIDVSHSNGGHSARVMLVELLRQDTRSFYSFENDSLRLT